MRCEEAELALSTAMDGAERLRDDVEAHARACPRCAGFRQRSWRLRELVRFQVAQPVPDLAPAVIERLHREAISRPISLRPPAASPFQRGGGVRPWLEGGRAAAVALLAGLVAGAVITAGGIFPLRRAAPPALAAEIPRRLLQAADGLEGYRATFDVTELNWTRRVPRRRFVAHVAFRAPEAFRVRVRDVTRYPSRKWPRNDLLLQTDGRAWRAEGPDSCPPAALPACPSARPVVRIIENRPPFDPQTAMPTDIIVPMTVLAASGRVEVAGAGRAAGRHAVAVSLAYRDAAPLFEYLRFLGSWRPFFPQDRVVVWLDRNTWFPLRYDVFPARGAERSLWAAQVGLPRELPGRSVFSARARSLVAQPPPLDLFSTARGPEPLDEGFEDAPPASLRSPHYPRTVLGMRRWRAGSFRRTPARPYRQSVVAYARGLSWLTISRVRGWNERRMFGVSPFAERVHLGAGKGVAYYEPATSTQPRQAALHTSRGDFLLASNLPRASLLAAARSLPLVGRREPRSWRVRRWNGGVVRRHLTPEEATRAATFAVLQPQALPPGYGAVAAETFAMSGTHGLTIVFRRPAAELDGAGLRLYQATGESLPPPTESSTKTVVVRGRPGRWSPQQDLLEWMENGVYRSLSGPSFGLGTLVEIAESLREQGGGGPSR